MISRTSAGTRHTDNRSCDDATLVLAALNDRVEFTALYYRYADAIYRFVLELTRSPSTADDITSETMIQAMESLHQFDPERGSFAGWLFAIARNQTRNHFRGHKRMWRAVSRLWEPRADDDLLTSVVDQEEASRVREALARLSSADREVLLLRYSGGLSSQQISETLGISDEAARTRLSRARKRIADDLGASNE